MSAEEKADALDPTGMDGANPTNYPGFRDAQKSNGYCAWHPKEGYAFETLKACELWATNAWKNSFAHYYMMPEQLEQSRHDHGFTYKFAEYAWLLAEKDGWRIRPVKLVPLDEGE